MCADGQVYDVGRCAQYVSLIWITITLAPNKSVYRFSNGE